MEITVYEDRSFTFELKTPPAARMLLKASPREGLWRQFADGRRQEQDPPGLSEGNGITATPVRLGEPGAPTITMGLPPNWADDGPDTQSWAYAEAFMKDSADPNDPATVDVLLSKLTGDVDQAEILDYAPGELGNLPNCNLPNYKSLQPPNSSTLSGFESVALGGRYTRDGRERIIAEKTVVIPTGGGVFVLQVNADAPKADAPALAVRDGALWTSRRRSFLSGFRRARRQVWPGLQVFRIDLLIDVLLPTPFGSVTARLNCLNSLEKKCGEPR